MTQPETGSSTEPSTEPNAGPGTELRMDADGLLHHGPDGADDSGAFDSLDSDADTPAAVVVDRFIADGRNGALTLTTEHEQDDELVTVVTVEGTEEDRPVTITQHLRVYRRRDHGFATYWRGDHETGQSWHTHTDRPTPYPRWDLAGWDFNGTVPHDAILPISDLHHAMLEFTRTGYQPVAVCWRAVE